jgi:hypothetical protein
MVVGLDVFKKYFEQYPDNYIIIGGTACDIIIGEAGFIPRATMRTVPRWAKVKNSSKRNGRKDTA